MADDEYFDLKKNAGIQEYLEGQYPDYNVKISAGNIENGQERLLGYVFSSPHAHQISAERKSGVFFYQTQTVNHPLFIINANEGTIKYLMDVTLTARTTPDMQYLMYDLPHLVDETKPAYDDSYIIDNTSQRFALVDLETLEIIRIIEWNRNVDVGGGFQIFRSLEPEYDFRIDYYIESGTYGTAYYSIERDELNVIFDIPWTAWEDAKPQRKIEPEELGR
jgi:hypothetical protein